MASLPSTPQKGARGSGLFSSDTFVRQMLPASPAVPPAEPWSTPPPKRSGGDFQERVLDLRRTSSVPGSLRQRPPPSETSETHLPALTGLSSPFGPLDRLLGEDQTGLAKKYARETQEDLEYVAEVHRVLTSAWEKSRAVASAATDEALAAQTETLFLALSAAMEPTRSKMRSPWAQRVDACISTKLNALRLLARPPPPPSSPAPDAPGGTSSATASSIRRANDARDYVEQLIACVSGLKETVEWHRKSAREVGYAAFAADHVVTKRHIAVWLSKKFGLPGWVSQPEQGAVLGGLTSLTAEEDGGKSEFYALCYAASEAPVPLPDFVRRHCFTANGQALPGAFAAMHEEWTAGDEAYRDACKMLAKYRRESMNEDADAPVTADLLINASNATMAAKQLVPPSAYVVVRRSLLANFVTGEAFRFDILPRLLKASIWRRAPVVWERASQRELLANPNWPLELPRRDHSRAFKTAGRIDFTQAVCVRRDRGGVANPAGASSSTLDTVVGSVITPAIKHRNWCELQGVLHMISESLILLEDALINIVSADPESRTAEGAVAGLLAELYKFYRAGERLDVDPASRRGWLAMTGWEPRFLEPGRRLRFATAFQAYPSPLSDPPVKSQEAPGCFASVLNGCCGLGTQKKLFGVTAPLRLLPYLLPAAHEVEERRVRVACFLQVIGLYAIMVASLSGLFVTMECPTAAEPHALCTFQEKWDQIRLADSSLPLLLLVLNLLTGSSFIVLNYRLFRRELFVILYFDTANYIAMNQLSGRKAVRAVNRDSILLGGVSRKSTKLTLDVLLHFGNVLFLFPLVSEVFYTWRFGDNITADMGYDEHVFVPETDDFLKSHRVVLDTLISLCSESKWYLHYMASALWGTEAMKDSAQYTAVASLLGSATQWLVSTWRTPAGRLGLVLGSPLLLVAVALFLLPCLLLSLLTDVMVRVREGVFPSTLHVLGDLRFYPALLRRMRVLNLECLILTLFCRTLLLLNLIAILIFAISPEYHHFGGLVTLVSALTNTEVVFIRVSQWNANLSDAYANFAATSIFLNVPMRSNVVDANYRWSKELFMPAGNPERMRKPAQPAPPPASADGGGGGGGAPEDVVIAMPHESEQDAKAKAEEAIFIAGEFDDWLALDSLPETGGIAKELTFAGAGAGAGRGPGAGPTRWTSVPLARWDGGSGQNAPKAPSQHSLRVQLSMAAAQASPPPSQRF